MVELIHEYLFALLKQEKKNTLGASSQSEHNP